MRKYREERPVLAICYDFDKTLSPDDMQAQGYIQEVYDGDVASFWKECDRLAKKHEMDSNLAYMYKMVEEAQGRIAFTRERLEDYGARVTLFPGVEEWFDRMKQYGEAHGVIVEHYIISSGLKEMIEGTSVAKAGAFERIYASSFLFNERGVAVWPAQVVNYTNKTQFLFRIEKGVLDVGDPTVNDHFPAERIRVPFRNMVYIGDSDTDVPCMKLVNSYGGHSIGVYHTATLDKTKVFKMMHEKRIKYFAPADYTEGSELDQLLKSIIDRTALNEKLEAFHALNRNETAEAYRQNSDEQRQKLTLIFDLESSESFSRTHEVIAELERYTDWTLEEAEKLFEIGKRNTQVRYILGDEDVCKFYQKLLQDIATPSAAAQYIQKRIEKKVGC